MQKVNYLPTKYLDFINNFNPNQLGIYFSLFFHLMILLFTIGLPDLFKPKQIALPNITPSMFLLFNSFVFLISIAREISISIAVSNLPTSKSFKNPFDLLNIFF